MLVATVAPAHAERTRPVDHAREIAALVRQGNEDAIQEARRLVITNNAKIRSPVIQALIDAGSITRATATYVPTATALTSQLKKLLRDKKVWAIPVASDCAVTGGTDRFATLTCGVSRCGHACRHETTTVIVSTGVRWRVDDLQARSNEDGACGHCE